MQEGHDNPAIRKHSAFLESPAEPDNRLDHGQEQQERRHAEEEGGEDIEEVQIIPHAQ